MALETLKDVKEIGGFGVIDLDVARKSDQFNLEEYDRVREQLPITIQHSENVISFKIQNGPVKEVGVNGCQIDTIIEAAKLIIDGLNKNFSCRENSLAITKLDESLMWLRERTRNREKRDVEGYLKE